MPYIQRENGKIVGVFSGRQAFATEIIDNDSPDLLAFLGKPVAPLTARQLRLGLARNGIPLESVEAAIDSIEDLDSRVFAKIEWEYASQFERSHPLVKRVGSALGLTEDQIDAMWSQSLTL